MWILCSVTLPFVTLFFLPSITFIYLKAKHDRWGLNLVRQLVYFVLLVLAFGFVSFGWLDLRNNFPLCSREVTKAGAQLHTDRAH